MDDVPVLIPKYAPQPDGVAWPTHQWPRGSVTNQSDLDDVIDQVFVDDTFVSTNAVVVVRKGRVVAERYGGVQEYFDRPAEPITATSQLLSWSMAKSMLHMIIGTLVDEGRLDPEARADVPEWRDPGDPRHAIRLEDLLAMRDGLAFIENYEIGQTSHVIDMLYGEGQHDVAGFTAALPLAHQPGSHFNYSSGTTNVLSRLVGSLVGVGTEYQDYIRTRLFAPTGMTSATPTLDPTGVWIASSFVHANALDFTKFGLLYLRGGQWDGRQLVSRAWTDTAQIPLSREVESGNLYSWQWWVTGDQYGTYWASGYEGQMISVVPALDALVVRFGHTPEDRYPALREWRARVLDVLARSN